MSLAAADVALRRAAAKYQGYAASPVIVDGVKHEFIRIMSSEFGIELKDHYTEIDVAFGRRGEVFLGIDPALLKTTVH